MIRTQAPASWRGVWWMVDVDNERLLVRFVTGPGSGFGRNKSWERDLRRPSREIPGGPEPERYVPSEDEWNTTAQRARGLS